MVVILVTKLYLTLATPWTANHQAPLFMGFPRQEYWSGLPFPSPEDLPNPEIKPESRALAGGFFLTAEQPGKPLRKHLLYLKLCSWCLGYNDASVVIVPIRCPHSKQM